MVDEIQRITLIQQMGYSMGWFNDAFGKKQWNLARQHLVKIQAGLGLMAIEVDEADPVRE